MAQEELDCRVHLVFPQPQIINMRGREQPEFTWDTGAGGRGLRNSLFSVVRPRGAYCWSTLNGMLLESAPLGVTTLTVPLVAPAGTVAVIK